MTERTEKPSPHESSTDTIIGALEIVANLLESQDEYFYEQVVWEAVNRLEKLETELSKLRGEK